jgi:hypothetical protein
VLGSKIRGLSAAFALAFVGETPCNDERLHTLLLRAPVPVECTRLWLRSREGHGEPKRSPYEGDAPSLAGMPSRATHARRAKEAPRRSDQSHPVRGEILFPASEISSPRPLVFFGSLPLVFFFISFCREEVQNFPPKTTKKRPRRPPIHGANWKNQLTRS